VKKGDCILYSTLPTIQNFQFACRLGGLYIAGLNNLKENTMLNIFISFSKFRLFSRVSKQTNVIVFLYFWMYDTIFTTLIN